MSRAVSILTMLPLAAALLAAPASAEDAEVLFDQGLAEMEAGHYETGCVKLGESYRLDPLPGVLFTLAECRAKAGQIATAVTLYGDFLQLVERMPAPEQKSQQARVAIAVAQRKALNPQVPELTLGLPTGTAKSVRVELDFSTLGAASLGAPLRLDPGWHVVTTQVPGEAVNEERFSIARGERKRIDLHVAPAPGSKAAAAGPGPRAPDDAGPSGRRVLAYAVGGVGVLGLVTSTALGAVVLSEKSVINVGCHDIAEGRARCDPAGLAAARRAQSLGLSSTISFGVGLAGLAVGALLLLTEPRRADRASAKGWIGPVVTSLDATGTTTLGFGGVW